MSGSSLPDTTGRIYEDKPVDTFSKYADICLRVLMVIVMAALFIWLNYKVINFVHEVFIYEGTKSTPPTIITKEVLMSLIGATTVQVGVAIVAIFAYLFPKSKA